MPSDAELSSDLVVHAARLVRLVRRTLELPAGIRALSLLDEHGPLGVTALAGADRCSQPTMSATVRSLAEAGWVEKAPHPTDARASVVDLTPAGRAELRRVRRRNGATVATRAESAGLDAADLETAVRVLRAVTEPTREPAGEPAEGGAPHAHR